MNNEQLIMDQSYHFFIEEVPELLESIEMGVLTLRTERTKNKVHEIMRSAHSLKGGAASVGLEEIKTIAHRLEDFFKALFDESLEIDTELETLLIQGFDCLKIPLLEQIQKGHFDAELALENSRGVFAQLQDKLGDALTQTEDYLPSSSDLGVDLVSSIFEVDIAEGIENLERIVTNPKEYNIGSELRNQAEVFAGFGELLGMPGFREIIQTTLEALDKHPEKALTIANLMIADVKKSRELVLAGERTSGGQPSAPLLSLTQEILTTAETNETELNSVNFRDQAYQFFVEEVGELLPVIETGLLTIKQQRDKNKVHEIMRAAHSIKGGSASVGLDTIKTIAHRLEDFFKALFDETLEIDSELESDLLAAFNCLKNPLIEQINNGSFNAEQALAEAQPVWQRISAKMGSSLQNVDNYIPSSTDLGVDIVSSVFQVDVAQEIERLAAVIANPSAYVVAGELKAALEVMTGFGEMLNLPGFVDIGQKGLIALEKHRDKALEITQIVMEDLIASRDLILAGDRTSGGKPSPALIALLEEKAIESDDNLLFGSPEMPEEMAAVSLDDVFGGLDHNLNFEQLETSALNMEATAEPSLEEIFGTLPTGANFDIIEREPLAQKIEEVTATPSLDDVFGDVGNGTLDLEALAGRAGPEIETPVPPIENVFGEDIPPPPDGEGLAIGEPVLEAAENTEEIHQAIESLGHLFDQLPSVEQLSISTPPTPVKPTKAETEKTALSGIAAKSQDSGKTTTNLSVRVDLPRLERMNNLIGELSINRNGLSLQNERLQFSVRELLLRFLRFQKMTDKLREMSDQMVIAPEKYGYGGGGFISQGLNQKEEISLNELKFDALEMDSYGSMYSAVQTLLEQMIQLEEAVDDIALYAKQSGQVVEEQRQMLNRMRDELMWARMLPLGEVLNRFPRTLRDLSLQYHKSVSLKLTGTGVLVDKAALEKLYDPLLHLLRNAFDHGIEPPEERKQKGKPEKGNIEIRAYHQGNQTIIEIKDDGRGLDLGKITQKAVQVGLLSPEQAAVTSKDKLFGLIFEAGFSTASEVSELSGRGVGLDVVRSQLQSLKGIIGVTSTLGEGTTFTLRLPLTLTIDKLLVCLVEKTAFALPSDTIEEIIVPEPSQIKTSGTQKFLHWQDQLLPLYRLTDLLEYRCYLPEGMISKTLATVPMPEDWSLPLLLLRRGSQVFAIEVERLVTEQELVIKPFGSSISAPSYTYGCTILGDGTLIPVINGAMLLEHSLDLSTPSANLTPITSGGTASKGGIEVPKTIQSSTILVVDDSAAMRRTLALSLERAGYRVLQARDGKDALDQLQQGAKVQMVICDIEMPNMNGFEFLGQRRRESSLMKIPVAMLTSRSNDKHRKLAMHLGANAYFTKPYIEQKFLDAINKLVRDQSLVGVE